MEAAGPTRGGIGSVPKDVMCTCMQDGTLFRNFFLVFNIRMCV
jgi:hypothetical protein